MVRINCCCDDLNRKIESESSTLGSDITNEITITTTPTILLSTINLNRKIIKIYFAQHFNPLALLWIQHGINSNPSKFTFALPLKNLYIDSSQANQPLSAYCSEGEALIKLTVVNKI
jgi:hypothetical protein